MNLDKDTIDKLVSMGLLNKKDLSAKIKNKDVQIPLLYEEYLKTLKNISASTASAYKASVEQFFKYIYDVDSIEEALEFYYKNNAKDITIEDVQNWKEYLTECNFSQTTIGIHLLGVRKFFDYVNDKLIAYFPTGEEIKECTGRIERVKLTAITHEEVLGIIDSTYSYRDRLIISLMYFLGMKRNEIRNLKEMDVNTLDEKVKIYNSAGKLNRVLPLDDNLITLYNKYIIEKKSKIDEVNSNKKLRALMKNKQFEPIPYSKYVFQPYKLSDSEQLNHSTFNSVLNKALQEYYLNNSIDLTEEDIMEKCDSINIETIRNSRRTYLIHIGKSTQYIMDLMGDTNVTHINVFKSIAKEIYN